MGATRSPQFGAGNPSLGCGFGMIKGGCLWNFDLGLESAFGVLTRIIWKMNCKTQYTFVLMSVHYCTLSQSGFGLHEGDYGDEEGGQCIPNPCPTDVPGSNESNFPFSCKDESHLGLFLPDAV